MTLLRGKAAFAGADIGILVLNARYPLMRGNVAHAGSFDFPVRYKVVDLPTGWWLELNEEKYQTFLRAAQELEAEGVRAITTGCGLFATWQTRAAAALCVPLFTSPLLMAPMLLRMLGAGKKLGVITAAGKRIYEGDFLANCGIDAATPFVLGELDACSEYMECIRLQRKPVMDTDEFERQVVSLALSMAAAEPSLGAFLLECSDIPPFSAAIARETGLPVFDFLSLIRMVHTALQGGVI